MAERKLGRPKKEQSRPLIFQRVRSRVSRQVTMSANTAETLNQYLEWAISEVDADKDEAMTLTMDQALQQFFARDWLFQKSLESGRASGSVASTARTPSPPATTPPSPSRGGI